MISVLASMSCLFAARTWSLACSSVVRIAWRATSLSEGSTSCESSNARLAAMAMDSAAFEEELDGWDMVCCAGQGEMKGEVNEISNRFRAEDISGETTTRCDSTRQARD